MKVKEEGYVKVEKTLQGLDIGESLESLDGVESGDFGAGVSDGRRDRSVVATLTGSGGEAEAEAGAYTRPLFGST